MPASPTSGRARALHVLTILVPAVLVAASGAFAQEADQQADREAPARQRLAQARPAGGLGEPVSLLPPRPPAAAGAQGAPLYGIAIPGIASPSDALPVPGGAPPAAMVPPPPDGIETAPLPAVDPDAVGVYYDAPRSLGVDLWQGSTRLAVTDAIRGLPVRYVSPSAHALALRLLLTAARVPPVPALAAGPAAPSAPSSPEGAGDEPVLTVARVGKLLAMGAFEDALALARAAGTRSEAMARLAEDALLLTGDRAAACDAAQDAGGRFAAAYWQEVLAWCRAVDGDLDGARLAMDLARDTGKPDARIATLLEPLLGGARPKLKGLAAPTPLELSVLAAAKLPLPRDALAPDRPDLARAVATAATAGPALRVEAGEIAVADNALPGGELARFYADPGVKPDKAWSPAGRAARFRRAAAIVEPNARAKALSELLGEARRRGDWPALAEASLGLLADLPPDPARGMLAEEAARALLFAGRPAEARNWYVAVTTVPNGGGNDDAARLWPLMALAGAGTGPERVAVPSAPDPLAAWWRQHRDQPAASAQAVFLAGLLTSFGIPIRDSLEVIGKVPPPTNQPLIAALSDPARSRGETVAGVLHADAAVERSVGEGRVPDPSLAIAALSALRRLKLDEEARGLAVEWALLVGI